MKFLRPLYKLIGYEETNVLVKCPWCGSQDTVQDADDLELVKCRICKRRTDLHEAMQEEAEE